MSKRDMTGLYHKYNVTKADGSDCDPGAQYFVLRIDTDRHARTAALAYAEAVRESNPALASDVVELVRKHQTLYFNILSRFDGETVIGRCHESVIADMLAEEPGVSFREITEDEFNKELDE